MTSEQKIDAILKLCEKQGNDIDEIKRGLYGDQRNKLPGLIDRQINDEKEIAAIKASNEKAKWWAAGFTAALTLIVSVLYNAAKQIFGL